MGSPVAVRRRADLNSSSIFIFGGFDGRQAVSDFYVVNIDIAEVY